MDRTRVLIARGCQVDDNSSLRTRPFHKAIPRGSLFHVRYTGKRAVAFVDGSTLALKAFRRKQDGALDLSIRCGLAVTIEAGEAVQVCDEVRQRMGQRREANGELSCEIMTR